MNPLYLALGVTLTASNAFMLPVSTPCNAIIYSAGGIRYTQSIAYSDRGRVGAIKPVLPFVEWGLADLQGCGVADPPGPGISGYFTAIKNKRPFFL